MRATWLDAFEEVAPFDGVSSKRPISTQSRSAIYRRFVPDSVSDPLLRTRSARWESMPV
jgi:hypothetical protein